MPVLTLDDDHWRHTSQYKPLWHVLKTNKESVSDKTAFDSTSFVGPLFFLLDISHYTTMAASIRYTFIIHYTLPPTLNHNRHEFYETDEAVSISIFDRGADPSKVSIKFDPRRVRSLSTHPIISHLTPHFLSSPTSTVTTLSFWNPWKARSIPPTAPLLLVKSKSKFVWQKWVMVDGVVL